MTPGGEPTAKPTRTDWASLLKRVFSYEPGKCVRCGGAMNLVAVVRNHEQARRYLQGGGQYADLPPHGRARGKPP